MTSSDDSVQEPSPLRAAEPHGPIGYRTTCPKCGGPLEVVALDPDSAPWLCNVCHRAFWAAELTDVARDLYRPRHHDWGQGTPARAVRQSVQTEWLYAHARGTSLRADQLRIAHTEHLVGIRRSGLKFADEFSDLLDAEIAGRG